MIFLLSDEGLSFTAKWDVVRELKGIRPINNLAIGIPWFFSAEWRPADKAFKHNCSHRPPIAAKRIALPTKNLWCNVVRCPDG